MSARGLLAAGLMASVLAAGCEEPFEPFQENDDAVFSMFGNLNLKADTQWVRVMPVRQSLVLDPGPLDAVVTLEQLGSSRVIAMRDSVFRFEDPRLDGVAYAHNFWTAERLVPGVTYRLRAERPDGASTTATVVMPEDLEISFVNDRRSGADVALLWVRGENVLFVDQFYWMSTPLGRRAESRTVRDHWSFTSGVPGTLGIGVDGRELLEEGITDVRRQEIRLTVGRSDWPFHPDLTDLEVSLPGTMPSNVENGVGFVGGLVVWTIPFHRCTVLEPRGDPQWLCTTKLDSRSASLSGRLFRAGCGGPHVVAPVRLTERFADGGAVVRSWKTGWDGEYRFEGIEPGAALVLDLGFSGSEVALPALSPGERYLVPDMAVPADCSLPPGPP